MDLHGAMCAALPGEDGYISFTITEIYALTPYRIDENDQKNFDRIMKLHPRFPELILAFKEDPDAYENFISMVSFQNLCQ